MKKLFITALFALLMGGFALTANAQPGVKPKPKANKEVSQTPTSTQASKPVDKPQLQNQTDNGEKPGVNYDTMIKDYKEAVNQFVADVAKLKEGTSTDKINIKTDKKAAEDLRKELEKKEVQAELKPLQKETIKDYSKKLDEALESYKNL